MIKGHNAFADMEGAEERFILTRNQMGFMTTGLDEFSEEIIRFAAAQPKPMLEVGAAYGVATLAALQASAKVIANDASAEHLEVLWNKTPEHYRGNLQLRPGYFPQELSFEPESVSAVLACRVIHFFDGKTIEESLEKIWRWLVPGGKVCIVAETVYIRTMQPLIEAYEVRKKNGEIWPGYFDNLAEFLPEELAKKIPAAMHLMDEEVLQRSVLQRGFKVEKCHTLNRIDFPDWLRLDGRESVGIIARKPV